MSCKFCLKAFYSKGFLAGEPTCGHCQKCGRKPVAGSFPFCPHDTASRGNRSGFESYTDEYQFPTDMTFHSASEIDKAAKANNLEVRTSQFQKRFF